MKHCKWLGIFALLACGILIVSACENPMGSRSSAKTQNLLGTVWEYTETKADKTTTVALKFEKATELSQQTTEKQGTVTSAPKTENLTYTFDSKTRKGTITTTSGAAAFTIDIGFKVLKYNGRDYKKK